jgi:glucose/arabinose dehydrogenase
VGPDGKLYFGMGSSCNACIETNELNATVLRCDPDRGSCEVFANGLRNVFEVAFHPTDGVLFGGDNGIDTVGEAKLDTDDELNLIEEGNDYGYPFCWGANRGMRCNKKTPSLVEFAPHAAPAGLAFYTGNQFPSDYRNNLFVTLWGDTGRSVVRVELHREEDGYRTTVSDFMRLDRPVDVAVPPNGTLLVLDVGTSAVYRVSSAPRS